MRGRLWRQRATPSVSQSRTHTVQRGGGAPSLHGVVEPPQGTPLREEAAEVETTTEEEGGVSWQGYRRANNLLPMLPQTTPKMFQTPPLPEGAQVEAMTDPRKRRA